ncbi:hypothetical protein [Lachnoclostridium sp. Marseille-P6806]|uniref:hypothetical protein n=1 Tax=Lachnoclostridium sp. Marseille-P6806 TaxID=2364793 RepID=UPI0013EF4072|nr:hypothetical protein [Lachnoclostridium sp. Marseille-P6806]
MALASSADVDPAADILPEKANALSPMQPVTFSLPSKSIKELQMSENGDTIQ